ncbi:MAG: hypothetical protein DMF72_17620 [Acidobacteria bacterium]|nr:MAG: hypothetical protein DMF72_17620 [Acidobacteriota bacterium]
MLFFRAYPSSNRVLSQLDQGLKKFQSRVAQLRDEDVDLAALDEPEVSGMAGTTVTSNFSYAVVRWLVAKYPSQLSIDWEWFEEEDRFGATMPRFMPLLEDDSMVEAHVPFRDWLRAAAGRQNELRWIIDRFESLEISDKAKAELYDSLKLHVTWKFGFRSSRTGSKMPTRQIFFHDKPLIQRRDISLVAELNSPSIPVQKLSRAQGEKILDMARETSAVRYRELHGFTYGDARRVLKADLGRGTEMFLMGVPPENRLPLRAYHAALVFKNSIPVAYFEGLSICERMESGFNLYYTFREGETAWLYARILRLMRQLLGVTVSSIDPYQVGHENEEGIESGAFWFYRKLGFRPVRPELMKLTQSEERKMTNDRGYRTSARTLRKLAAGHMLFELPGVSTGKWDCFQVRNIGLAVQHRMARDFNSNPREIREYSLQFVQRVLKIKTDRWADDEREGLQNLSLVLGMIPEIEKWSLNEKEMAARIIRAKGDGDEDGYLKLMQKHMKLRDALISLGS